MKTTDLNLDLISNLSGKSKDEITKHNCKLVEESGATLSIQKVEKESIQVNVVNVNGHRTQKSTLLKKAYKILSENIPKEYRLQIRL